jgi:hypothetical protein
MATRIAQVDRSCRRRMQSPATSRRTGANLEAAMRKLLGVALVGALLSLGCTGLTGSTITVNLPDAGGLEVGQPVRLSGLDIGEVTAVRFQEGSDGVAAELSISDEGLSRLDPDTIFVVQRSREEGPTRVVTASNLCVTSPRGLTDGAVLSGYSGPMPRVILEASRDRPQCAATLIEGLLSDLQGAASQLEQSVPTR